MFRELILHHLRPGTRLLDLGAGAGIVEHMNFRGLVGRVCGVDLDARVVSNPMLDEGRVADVTAIPYTDAQFDVVFSDNVLEHLSDPVKVLQEVARVLVPGGIFLFKTPNKWHYMPTIARLTPHSFHELVNRWRGRAARDTFPTRYLINTYEAIETFAGRAELQIRDIRHIEGRPEYLRMSALTYPFGYLYERLVNSAALFSHFRVLLVGTLQKPSGQHD